MPEEQYTAPVPETPTLSRPSGRIYALLGGTLVCLTLIGAVVFFSHEESLAAAQQAAAASALPDTSVFDTITLTAASAFVFDMHTGTALYEKQADTPRALASLTKLMLALVVIETLAPGDAITISERALMPEGGSALAVGEQWMMQDLLDYTMVVSSNDGAYALAEAAGKRIKEQHPGAPEGDTEAAIWRMNEKAKELGLSQTYFLDSHGLDESASMAGAYGSASDMAALFAYAARHASEALAATAYPRISTVSPSGVLIEAANTNDAIGNIPGLMFGKTGFTDLAGGNLGVVFDAGLSRPIVIVVLGSTQEARFSDVEQLAEAAREAIQYR